ncbi:unnamed protein product [Brassica rapa]|uniref:GTP diphosphokinase n=1 Tax=Brassica campestris TaxID=3711 RepID=A0A3P6A436_BRACM|nr:unnamed protein product [Brassica rapa]VDC81973.1 unnamed protein product [Brassica rapa]
MSVIRPSPIPIPRCRSQTVYRRLHSIHFIHHHQRRRRWNPRSEAEDTATARSPEAAGGKMVVELVGAFNEVTERMNSVWLSTSSSRLLFKALKLSIPILQSLPLASDGRSPLSKALSLSILLADLQNTSLYIIDTLSSSSSHCNVKMDAEVISASILSEVVEANAISIHEVRDQIGTGTAQLLHEIFRIKNIPFKVDVLDDETAASLRKFYLTYYDIRAVIMDLVSKLDEMRHLDHLPRYRQQILSLQVLKIYSPLAHAVGANHLSLELEDISFRYLFPMIDVYKEQLLCSLKDDLVLSRMVDDVYVKGRYKSRYSMMKKLLRDGRKPEEVNDVLGLRVILMPNDDEVGEKACYRTSEIVRSIWKEIPHRTKDYITKPKANGYRSLHMAVDVSDSDQTRPLMEIQIRTVDMDGSANAGTASHSLYKGGLTDPKEAKRLKAIMMAAADLAAIRLKDLSSNKQQSLKTTTNQRDRVFCLLDKNGDGMISIEELMEVMDDDG